MADQALKIDPLEAGRITASATASSQSGKIEDAVELNPVTLGSTYTSVQNDDLLKHSEKTVNSEKECLLTDSGTNNNTVTSPNDGSLTTAKSAENITKEDTDTAEGPTYTRRQYICLVLVCALNLLATATMSIGVSFFPVVAIKKGTSLFYIGMALTAASLIHTASTPLFARYLTSVGPKFTFVLGAFVSGVATILFAFLDKCPNGWIFVLMVFLSEAIEGLGTAAAENAGTTIIAADFRQSVNMVMSAFEGCSGIGLMIGPVLGGALYQAGGFRAPYLTAGLLMLALGLAGAILLTDPPVSEEKSGSFLGLLKIPLVAALTYMNMVTLIGLSAIEIGFAVELRTVGILITPLAIGGIFLLNTVFYTGSGALYGWIVDEKGGAYGIILVGVFIVAISYLIIGPAPFLGFIFQRTKLWPRILVYILASVSSSVGILSYKVMLDAGIEKGYSDDVNTYALVGGAMAAGTTAGETLGQVFGGGLMDAVGFPWMCVVVAGLNFLAGVFLIVAKSCSTFKGDVEKEDEKTGLVKKFP